MFTQIGKKIYRISFLIIVVSATALMAHAAAAQESEALLISSFQGEVLCFKSGLNKWVPAEEGLELEAGDSVRAEKASFCDVRFGDTSFRIKEKSLLTVNEILKRIELKMEYGTILTRIKNLPPESEFVVRTPEAVIGARGTRYKVYVEKEPDVTYTSVLEESVLCGALGEPDRSVVLTRYKRTQISPWRTAAITAKGSGVLSEIIPMPGVAVPKKVKSEISIKSYGDTKEDALNNLTEKISAIHLDERTTVADLLTKDTELLRRVYNYIARNAVITTVSESGGEKVEALILLDPISKIINRDIFAVSNLIYSITADEYTKKFGPMARVTTKRAAKVDAFRKLAEIIYGTVIDSETTLEDYAVTSDVIKSKVIGIVQGAREVGIEYFSDGSITVGLETEAYSVKNSLTPHTGDVFGKHYIAKPSVIYIEDFEEYLVE